jgi:hypothetical protein
MAIPNTKPFQLDEYSINRRGINLDIFPVKKAVLTQLNISAAGASSEHFYRHGPMHKDNANGQQNTDSNYPPRLDHYKCR